MPKKFLWSDKTGRGFTNTLTLAAINSMKMDRDEALSWDGEYLKTWAKTASQGDEWENATDKYICTES